MCFYAYKNVLEPMGHHGANLIFSILTLNQVRGLWSLSADFLFYNNDRADIRDDPEAPDPTCALWCT